MNSRWAHSFPGGGRCRFFRVVTSPLGATALGKTRHVEAEKVTPVSFVPPGPGGQDGGHALPDAPPVGRLVEDERLLGRPAREPPRLLWRDDACRSRARLPPPEGPLSTDCAREFTFHSASIDSCLNVCLEQED